MNGSYKCTVLCLFVKICVQLVSSEKMQAKDEFLSVLKDFKSLADTTLQVRESNFSSKEFCMKSFERANRYKNIIYMQRKVNLKLQSELLKQIQDCSNFRQRVHRLIAKYKKLKSELKDLRTSVCSLKKCN
ncbi:uncharacterized protein LOC108137790 [Drosophila elegans]|uniref:uncharacterized protein LOC108137790 n=1 Tax=Drosophila elegans TaxID=30023 RepID=UPI0007E7327E|nr:uncharacterized protein LOC108137790 [Drosophila elegans]